MALKKLFDITVYKTKNFQVNQDWEVPIQGFFIIVPTRKVKSITDLSEQEAQELISIIQKVRMAMRKVLKIEEVCLLQDEASSHFHIWLLPRYSWMKKVGFYSLSSILNYAKKNKSDKKNIQKVKQTAQTIKEYLKK